MGGGINGGQVYGRWSSLAARDLHEARDLPTTTDFRAVLASILNDQMEVSRSALSKIFPDFSDTRNPFVTA
jgi:uncharacterized protein (DUF1501 family)